MTDISKKIKEDFQEIRLLVLKVNSAFNTIYFIKSEGADMITRDYKLFNNIYNSIGSSLVIDLCKLFNTNYKRDRRTKEKISKEKKEYDHYSFNKFFLNLKQYNKQIEWCNEPNESLIDEELIKILDKELLERSTIEKLKEARDKFHAHLDKNRPLNLQIDFDEIELLIDLAKSFVNKVYNPLLDGFQSFEFLHSDDTATLMMDLYKYKKIKQVINDSKEDVEYSFEKILDIIGNKI
ncbi:hypothetical protein [Plebeiibacterium marinum]|uniref:HEPN AbiU2-like domain-containing protein n=1 Tax=Plebeiibacterium marinum TaxID=2992111 RepID=A0AAE3SLN9_9BACT|nr:hypothetical protein [Plebeiobacterium marinum]MCW3808085.1 hypothetical protein [Plebeiobacterium marinum]